jgi:peptidoglycan/xylan/chitin deacetylase (PgdA/CDA1 family)
MTACVRAFLITVLAAVTMASHAQLSTSTSAHTHRWPHGARAAVSLAYDDALNSQLDIAVPALNRHGLKASFYLTLSSETAQTRMRDWRKVADQGHELGNHTLFHQCSRSAPNRSWVTPDNDLDTTTVDRLVAQIRVGNTLLHAIDGKTLRSFTTPCGDLLASGKPYLEAIQGDFVAMKTKFGGVVPEMSTLDPYSVGIEAPADISGPQLIALVQRAADAGTMVNITFHGVGGDYLTVSREAHEELLNYLSIHHDIYWTDTFINIMQYVKAQRLKAKPLTVPSPPQKSQ